MRLKLYIGNYNYSSWSLRPWLVLRKAQLAFTEEVIDLDVPGYKARLQDLSHAATVPVLELPDGVRLPDSLAISEFCAKAVPNLWPKAPEAKQQAQAVVAKMHSGFEALRAQAPMNLRRRTRSVMSADCLADAEAMVRLWMQCLSRHDGPFLFGDWSIADAFYTPAATRFVSYNLPRHPRADVYISELLADEDFQNWEQKAFSETHRIEATDNIHS